MTMRISDSMIFRQMSRGIQSTQRRSFEAQRKAMSGLRVEKPSDDPAAAHRGVLLESQRRQLDSMKKNSATAFNELGTAENALGTVSDLLNQVRVRLLQGMNGTMTAADRSHITTEISALKEEMLSIANTRVGNVYVFGGFKTNTEPFQADGTFLGEAGSRRAEVAPGITVEMNISGDSVFAPAGGTNLFGSIDQMLIDLTAGDDTAMAARLDDMDTLREQVLSARVDLGSNLAQVERADENRDDLGLYIDEAQKSVVGIDQAESYVDLVANQHALNSAISQARKVLQQLQQPLF
jgi:flagellar hook-associated protein 3 FlgL